MSKTKIVCTVGPASSSPQVLERMINAGMNVARLNFSHGSQSEHRKVINKIRNVSEKLHQPIAIIQDLAGPKIRVGNIKSGSVKLESGKTFILTNRKVPGDENEVSITYPNLPKDVESNDTLLLNDGEIELKVLKTTEKDISCRVIVGGSLSSNKGINLPSRSIRTAILTEKDRKDLALGIEENVDYIALSFVRNAGDVLNVKELIQERGNAIPLIAKIEKHEALQNIDEIMEVVDGIMVARGDLGVETPFEKVPLVQKMLIEKSNQWGKPVITATHMLQSMVDSPRPTRAEATDVANAILDGSDAVMLSEETAIGRFPVRAVDTMTKIARDAETGFQFDTWINRFGTDNAKNLPDAVSLAACNLAKSLNAVSIITFTQSGSTARLVSKYRPRSKIIAATPNEKTYRLLSLVWGVIPILTSEMTNTDEMTEEVLSIALESGIVRSGQKVVITAGTPLGIPGKTNLIKAEEID